MFDKKQALWIGLIAPLAYPVAFAAQATTYMYFFLALVMAAAMIFGGTAAQGEETVEFSGHDLLRHGGYASAALALCMAPDFVLQLFSLQNPPMQTAANVGWLLVPAVVFIYPVYCAFMGVRMMWDAPGRREQLGRWVALVAPVGLLVLALEALVRAYFFEFTVTLTMCCSFVVGVAGIVFSTLGGAPRAKKPAAPAPRAKRPF